MIVTIKAISPVEDCNPKFTALNWKNLQLEENHPKKLVVNYQKPQKQEWREINKTIQEFSHLNIVHWFLPITKPTNIVRERYIRRKPNKKYLIHLEKLMHYSLHDNMDSCLFQNFVNQFFQSHRCQVTDFSVVQISKVIHCDHSSEFLYCVNR